MASGAMADVMAKQLPPEFTDLSTVVRNGQRSSVNVIGSVIDSMPPSQTRGTDMQMTFTICDNSTLTNGLRVKYFKKEVHEFPKIGDVGDILLLRGLKISMYRDELIGISSYQTEHIVFPKDSIVSPEFRHRYAVQREYLHHTKSSGAPAPDIHEQQWVITLRAHFGRSSEDKSLASRVPAAAPPNSPGITREVVHITPPSGKTTSQREKFSLIKNVQGGDRNGGSRLGNFYDLAGEVVKLFFNLSLGILDLYLTDYTVNNWLPDHKSSHIEAVEQNRWQGPSGKMTLHIELYPPHATWTYQNINEGDFVYLQNVRVKWNQRGLGTELEGNIWADKLYADRVYVSLLRESNPQYGEIQARKTSYLTNIVGKESKSAKRKKNRAKRDSKRRKLTNPDGVNVTSPDQSDQNNDSEGDEHAKIVESLNEVPEDRTEHIKSTSSKKLNPNIKCLFPDVPLSSLDVIVNNKNRWTITPSGEKYEVPFINVRHRARLRAIDYFPHALKDFAVCISDSRNPDRVSWQWHFWLVLEDGDPDEADSGSINVQVSGEYAEDLLQIIACDLSRNPQRLVELEQTLFLLWGELAEQKNKFLHSHPQIKADSSFSAIKYNIRTDNRAFDTCIEESGIPKSDESEIEGKTSKKEWMRVFNLFGTRIKR